MKTLKFQYLFWLAALFFLTLGIYWLNIDDAIVDINIHDTYYVIHNFDLMIIFTLLYGLIGFVYWIFYKLKIVIIKWLSKIHTLITISAVLVYFIGSYIIESRPKSEFPLFDENSMNLMAFITILIIIVLIAQLIFISNIIISLTKYGIQRATRN